MELSSLQLAEHVFNQTSSHITVSLYLPNIETEKN